MRFEGLALSFMLVYLPNTMVIAGPHRSVFLDHFMDEALWVSRSLKLDVGDDDGPRQGWLTRGTKQQRKNKEMVINIVEYCAADAHAQFGEIPDNLRNLPSLAEAAQATNDKAMLIQWRVCETAEIGAYRRMITQAEFKDVDDHIIKQCVSIPDRDSYVAIENCVNYERSLRR